MDRRDLFKTIAGVAAGAGVVGTVKVAEASERTVPALAIFESTRQISQESAARIAATFEQAIKGTPFEGMKALVIGDDSLRLTMLDASGRVLNRDISEA